MSRYVFIQAIPATYRNQVVSRYEFIQAIPAIPNLGRYVYQAPKFNFVDNESYNLLLCGA